MANINLHKNTFNLSLLSLPLFLSPPSFSSLRFSPLHRRLSHSSFLAKLSSHSSSPLHIISTTQHSDGTVSFKFGDASEVSKGLESVESVNGIELERDSEGVSVEDNDESEGLMAEKIVVTSVKLTEIVSDESESLVEDDELENSSSVGEKLEDLSGSLIDDEHDCNSSLVEEEGENSSDLEAIKDEIEVVEGVVNSDIEEVEELSVVSEELNDVVSEETRDGDRVDNGGEEPASSVEGLDVVVVSLKDEIVEPEVSDHKIESGDDESLIIANVEGSDGGKVEYGGDEPALSVEGLDVVVVSLKDEIVEPEVSDHKIESGDDESLIVANVEGSDGGKVEYGGDESLSKIGELSSNFEALEVAISLKDDGGGDDRVELMSAKLEDESVGENSGVSMPSLGLENGKVPDAASPAIVESDVSHSSTDLMEEDSPESSQIPSADRILDSVNVDISTGVVPVALAVTELTQCSEVLEADNCSTMRLDDDPHNIDTSDEFPPNVEALVVTSETTLDSIRVMDLAAENTRENSLHIEHESSDVASSPLSSEVNGSSPNLSQSNDQPSSDISQATGPDSSGIRSEKVSSDSQEISAVSNSTTPTSALSLDSTEVDVTTTDSISESDRDVLLAADLITSEITSSETTLDSLNEMETSTPALFTSSGGASLSHSVEALAGGKDAYFVYEDWFGVADGVNQWSLEGVGIGLYAHELMQNCEKLIKSMDSGITNVKELLKQSDLITESTGSARVIIAHVANQVLHVANIGDSGFVVIRNGIVFKRSSPMVHEFGFPYAIGLGDDSVEDVEEYHVELEDGDVIVTATDGLFDNLYEEEIASIVSKALKDGMHVQDIAELLGTKAQEVGKSESARSPFADAAQAAGHPGYSGGKHDHVTVIVSLVQKR